MDLLLVVGRGGSASVMVYVDLRQRGASIVRLLLSRWASLVATDFDTALAEVELEGELEYPDVTALIVKHQHQPRSLQGIMRA